MVCDMSGDTNVFLFTLRVNRCGFGSTATPAQPPPPRILGKANGWEVGDHGVAGFMLDMPRHDGLLRLISTGLVHLKLDLVSFSERVGVWKGLTWF